MSRALTEPIVPIPPVWPLERPPADFGRALGPPLTSLIGRDAEVDLVANLLLGGARCVTLVGPGGVGKTRLALAVATDLFPSVRHGVRCVPLAGLDRPERVGDAIATALELHEQPGISQVDMIADWLREREVLLLLDNFEHLLPAAPLLSDLLRRCPSLTCLVTSRAPLHISGEQLVTIDPLPVPPKISADEAGDQVTAVAQNPVVELFVQRAHAADPRFALTPANAAAVAELCRRLDGLPLAIELAAAHAHVLTPSAMLNRMDRRLQLLGGGPSDQPARLQTIRQTIAWSYDLLSPAAQRLFRALAVAVSGATLELIEAILPAADNEGDQIAALRELVEQQLVQRIDAPDEPRYVMLQTVYAYAQEQLDHSDERERTAARHAAWAVAFADRLKAGLTGYEDRAWLDRFDQETPNFRAALDWMITRGERETAMRLACAVSPATQRRGRAGEGIDWIERAQACPGPAAPAEQARALAALSSLHFVRGDYDRSWACCEAVIPIAEPIGDDRDLGTVLTNFGCICNHRGDWKAAFGYWEMALVVQRRTNDLDGIAALLNNMGIVNVAQGDLALARTQLAEAYRIRQAHGPTAGLAYVTFNLSQLASVDGNSANVIALLMRTLELYRSIDDPSGVAFTLYGLGLARVEQGDIGGATEAYLEALPLAERCSDAYTVCSVLDGLATIELERGRYVEAATLHGLLAWMRRQDGSEVHDHHRQDHDRELGAIRSHLTAAEFNAAWGAGELMRLSDAVAMIARDQPPAAPDRAETATAAVDHGLSARELEVLRLVVAGSSDKEIGEALFISRKTASAHVSAILRKIGVANRAGAVTYAHRHRLV